MKVIIYHSSILKAGGIETFIYNFVKRMRKHIDLELYFHDASITQLLRYSDYVNCTKFKGQDVECDVLILASAWGEKVTHKIKAKKVIQMIHANLKDYKKLKLFNFKQSEEVTDYVSVSHSVAKALKELHDIESKVIYNLTDNEALAYKKKKNKSLNLITASRISREKGLERCIELAKQLHKANIEFEWHIYGDSKPETYKENLAKQTKELPVYWHPFTLDIKPKIASSDYLVQLSDTEGFCYSIIEALQLKTPCIVTPFESAKEQINEGENGYIIPFDMQGIDIDTIVNKIPKITKSIEFANEKDWLEIIHA